MDSINTYNSKRDKHLLSKEFFNAADHPLLLFESTSIIENGDNSYSVKGTFTVKGKEYDLTLPLVLAGIKEHPMKKGMRVAGFNGEITIDRLLHGVGSGKFYKAGVVGKEVKILITLEVIGK